MFKTCTSGKSLRISLKICLLQSHKPQVKSFRLLHSNHRHVSVFVEVLCTFWCLSNLVPRIQPFGFGHDSFTPESFTFHPQLHSPCHPLATPDK